MSSSSLRVWESRLTALLGKLAKKRGEDEVCLIEVVDAAGLWADSYDALGRVLRDTDFDQLLTEFPVLGCCAATEIGYRFEGVGTVFWAKFEELLGSSIPAARRFRLAEAFEGLSRRYAISVPVESGFSGHFSIITWPITNALMPFEIAAPVGRLLSRGPAGQSLHTGSRRVDLTPLRTWALTWEGARLADWLRSESPTSRVIAALLTDNASGSLNEASYRRLKDAFTHQSEAYFALREARRRRRGAAASAVREGRDLGRLALEQDGGDFWLTVAWSPLAPALLEQARQEASARNWRPKLWGQCRTHFENALGSLPIPLHFASLPEGQEAFPHAMDVFGGSSTAQALSSRIVDWTAPLLFRLDPAERLAERVEVPLNRADGEYRIIDPEDEFPELPVLGECAGASVRAANLLDADAAASLLERGWLHKLAPTSERVARAPLDALTRRRGSVSPRAPICIFNDSRCEVTEAPARGQTNRGLRAEEGNLDGPASPGVFLFDREKAFDAIIDERLSARVESSISGASWPVEVMLLIGEEVVSYARELVVQERASLPRESRIWQALHAENVRRRLLVTGRATLRIRVGNHPWDTITLLRSDGEVDWESPQPWSSLSAEAELVLSSPSRPFIFSSKISADTTPVCLQAYRLRDGRFASPGLIRAPAKLELAALSADFSGVEGVRRLHAGGAGVLDLVRARRTWATARCDSLGAVATRVALVDQFDGPLVTALCGKEWRGMERRKTSNVGPGQALAREIQNAGLVELPREFSPEDRAQFEARFGDRIGKACPSWTEDGELHDETADTILMEVFDAVLVNARSEGRLEDVDPDDYDFGAPAESWRACAEAAIASVSRSPLLDLVAPPSGARALARASFESMDLAQAANFLADWTREWCLARSSLGPEGAYAVLQLWLNPAAGDGDQAVHVMSRDAFLARAARYIARRSPGYGRMHA